MPGRFVYCPGVSVAPAPSGDMTVPPTLRCLGTLVPSSWPGRRWSSSVPWVRVSVLPPSPRRCKVSLKSKAISFLPLRLFKILLPILVSLPCYIHFKGISSPEESLLRCRWGCIKLTDLWAEVAVSCADPSPPRSRCLHLLRSLVPPSVSAACELCACLSHSHRSSF